MTIDMIDLSWARCRTLLCSASGIFASTQPVFFSGNFLLPVRRPHISLSTGSTNILIWSWFCQAVPQTSPRNMSQMAQSCLGNHQENLTRNFNNSIKEGSYHTPVDTEGRKQFGRPFLPLNAVEWSSGPTHAWQDRILWYFWEVY